MEMKEVDKWYERWRYYDKLISLLTKEIKNLQEQLETAEMCRTLCEEEQISAIRNENPEL